MTLTCQHTLSVKEMLNDSSEIGKPGRAYGRVATSGATLIRVANPLHEQLLARSPAAVGGAARGEAEETVPVGD